ncbi:unnamed protein product [Peniophora sp. CBMAI 1063]|nr:unnamed protein product [Peniophora sp. CBMAI 1063]
MSTLPETTAAEGPDRTGKGTQNRLRMSDSSIENAKAAAKMAVDVLSVIAEMTESVPYLGAISTALTAFKEVLDEVSVCKEDCQATMDEANQFKELIQKHQADWVELEADGDDGLREAFEELGKVMLGSLTTLQSLKVDSKRRRDWFRLLFKRDEVQTCVKQCRDKMRVAKEKFLTLIAMDTNRVVRETHRVTHELHKHVLPLKPAAPAYAGWRLRAANNIFHGRETEVATAVDMIVNKQPARVAILGPGGIGKTSIALAILHDPLVKDLYGDRRCFMSCEATTTADAVVRALADALGLIALDEKISPGPARDRIFSYLRTCSGILCLDNMETPLDADRILLDELLNEIAALPSVALLITSRATSIPTIEWTEPALSHIRPFSQKAALATWDDRAKAPHDDFVVKLVDAVDCMPLAVTLLASVVAFEGSAKRIWDRWQDEHTDLIRTGTKEDRLNSVPESIDLSLRALSDRDREAATKILCIVCLFSEGFWDARIPQLGDVFKEHSISVSRCLTILRQLSLIYTDNPLEHTKPEWLRFRALSPIRHHILQHYISDNLVVTMAHLVAQEPLGWDQSSFWAFILDRPGSCRDRCLEVAISSPSKITDRDALSQALAYAKSRSLELRLQSTILRQLGYIRRITYSQFKDARAHYSEAVRMDEQLGDTSALFSDWVGWVASRAGELGDKEATGEDLEELQEAILTAWTLGQESQVWVVQGSDDRYWDHHEVTEAQHVVNVGRRKLDMPIIYRSGRYSDNDSTAELHSMWEGTKETECYERLLQTSPPPWDLPLMLETHRALGHDEGPETSHSGLERESSEAGGEGVGDLESDVDEVGDSEGASEENSEEDESLSARVR